MSTPQAGRQADELGEAVKIWTLSQLAIWQARKPHYGSAVGEYKYYNDTRGSTYLFDVKDGRVSLAPKSPSLNASGTDPDWMLPERAELYRGFLQEVVDRKQPRGEGVIAMDMHDGAFTSESAPLFAFQKPFGSHAVLLNEIDALGSRFYSIPDVQDSTAFEDKAASAIFVGGTTGMLHTVDTVRSLVAERIRAGVVLKDHPLIDFRLPILSQFLEPEAEAMMRSYGFGKGATTWREQFKHKFLISIDGNGATCSRVAIALKSNSVLLKYNSVHALHYFGSLIPWRHYIPIAHDEEVPLIVQAERDAPGRFAAVAREGRTFYETYLTHDAQLSYAAELMESYFALFEREAVVPGWRLASDREDGFIEVSGFAHIAVVGDVPATDNRFGEPMVGRPMEGFLVHPIPGLAADEFEYQAVAQDGSGDWVRVGEFAGTRSKAGTLLGVRVRLLGAARDGLTCFLAASFGDGRRQLDMGADGLWEAMGAAPLQTFRIVLRRPVESMSGLAHVAGRGDIWSLGRTIGEAGCGDAIEGFVIEAAPGVSADELEYQAVSMDGGPGEWTRLGEFAGRKRTGLALKGLRVRLLNDAAERLVCRLQATFLGGATMAEAAGEVVEAIGSTPLESFTLHLQDRKAFEVERDDQVSDAESPPVPVVVPPPPVVSRAADGSRPNWISSFGGRASRLFRG